MVTAKSGRRSMATILFVLVASSLLVVTDARPAKSAVCLAHAVAPDPFKTSAGVRKIRFRGWAECATPQKGIRVHVRGYRDYQEAVENNASLNTCGGPTSPATHSRCPASAPLEKFAVSSAHNPGMCHTYYTYVWIDVVWNSQAHWSLQQDGDITNYFTICNNDFPGG